ncbi:hypothetical protein JVU11DRAFT_4487 [Chiua virens]|nr:hypothetical protein JVU11DRAFT_4487 [Chiua virens]
MIIRVWAMYHRSKLILGILLVLYFIEVVANIACDAFNSVPKNSSLVANLYCGISVAPPLEEIILEQVAYASLIIFGATLCVLAVVQFVRQSFQMYRVTKQWQLNRYINALVKQGIVYFFAFLLLNVIALLYSWGKTPSNTALYFFLSCVMYVPVYTLPPRFIISIRELHEQDVRGRGGIDSGFGLLILSDRAVPRLHIVFEGREENEAGENIEADAGQSGGGTESIQMVLKDVELAS